MLVESHPSGDPEATSGGIVKVCPTSPLANSLHLGAEEHELVLLAGHRLVQWAEEIAHHAGNRSQPGAIRWDRTLADDPAESVRLLEALLTATEQELGLIRATLEQVQDHAVRDAQRAGRRAVAGLTVTRLS